MEIAAELRLGDLPSDKERQKNLWLSRKLKLKKSIEKHFLGSELYLIWNLPDCRCF